MSMTFQNFLEGGYVNAKAKNRLAMHLSNASKSIADPMHPAHEHIRKAAAEIGAMAVKDRSEDNSGKPGDYTSPGTISSDSMRAQGGSGPVPGPGEMAARAAATEIFKS